MRRRGLSAAPVLVDVPTAGSERGIVGVETEYVVRDGGTPVDFRTVINGLGLGQPNLDPADMYAYHLPSGAAVIADGAEAEIALPPTPIRPGFGWSVALRARAERSALANRLRGLSLEGCSTHLSVSVRDDLVEAVCGLYAERFAPALMLLMDRASSPGLLIRPRPGRVELGGEFVTGSQLAAAAVFAVGSVRACEAALTGVGDARLPPALLANIERAVVRYGWYVDRTAFGGDLYRDGRAARLQTAGRTAISAQEVLEVAWDVARAALAGAAGSDELALVSEAVRGMRPLPVERAPGTGWRPRWQGVRLPPVPHGSAVIPRRRATFGLAPVLLTWDLAVYVVAQRGTSRRAFAAVDGAHLRGFLEALDSGGIDSIVDRYLDAPPARRTILARGDVPGVVLADAIGPRIGLLATEPRPHGRPRAVDPRAVPRSRLMGRSVGWLRSALRPALLSSDRVAPTLRGRARA
jgi:hypothetical protein